MAIKIIHVLIPGQTVILLTKIARKVPKLGVTTDMQPQNDNLCMSLHLLHYMESYLNNMV